MTVAWSKKRSVKRCVNDSFAVCKMLYRMSKSLSQTHPEIVKIGAVLRGNQKAFQKN